MLAACQSRQALICLLTVQSWFHTAQLFTFCEILILNVMTVGMKIKLRRSLVMEIDLSIFNGCEIWYEIMKMMKVDLVK